jgi:hypothetical protein
VTNPGRSRNVALLWLAGGIAAVVVAAKMPDAGKGFTLQAVLGIGGLTVVPFALVLALMRTADARRYARLGRGEGLMARWTIPPSQWQAFVANNEALNAERGEPNLIDVHGIASGNGVDVAITGESLSVGGDFHTFERDVEITVGPGWVEFYQYLHVPQGTDGHFHYRFPTVSGVERELQRLRGALSDAYEEAVATSYAKSYIVILLLGPIAAALFFVWFFGV